MNNNTPTDQTDYLLKGEHVIDGESFKDDDLQPVDYDEFDEILERASIPALDGLAGRVAEVLQNRAGNSSLSIEDVADDIQLSKRTLQRYLRREDIHFGALRDRVRFNIAIDCLMYKEMTVEEAAAYLGFSDRTSFTYAFKRWTSMSPSAFRKLYRDYM